MIQIEMNAGTLQKMVKLLDYSEEICGIVKGDELIFASRDVGGSFYGRLTTKIKNEGEDGIIPFNGVPETKKFVGVFKGDTIKLCFDGQQVSIKRESPLKEVVLSAMDPQIMKYASTTLEDEMTQKIQVTDGIVHIGSTVLGGKFELSGDQLKELISDAELLEQGMIVFQTVPDGNKMKFVLHRGNEKITSEVATTCNKSLVVAFALRFLKSIADGTPEKLIVHTDTSMPAYITANIKGISATYCIAPRILSPEELKCYE